MKKVWAILVVMGLLATLAACSSANGQGRPSQSAVDQIISELDEGAGGSSQAEGSNEPAAGDGGNILVAYFTMPDTSGVDAVAMASRVVENGRVVGNTEFISQRSEGRAKACFRMTERGRLTQGI